MLIEPGVYNGNLTPGVDIADNYEFDATTPTAIRFRFEGQGSIYAAFDRPLTPERSADLHGTVYELFLEPGRDHLLPIPEAGRWALRISLGLDEAIPRGYSFEFSLHPEHLVLLDMGVTGWKTLEFRIDHPGTTHVRCEVRFDLERGTGAAVFGMEYAGEGVSGLSVSPWLFSGFGRTVFIRDVAGPTEAPDIDTFSLGNAFVGSSITLAGGPWILRKAVVTDPAATSSMECAAVSEYPVTVGSANGEGALVWKGEEGGVLFSPAAGFHEASHRQETLRDFLGFFTVGEAVGSARAPDGREWALSPANPGLAFMNPLDGEWSFMVGERTTLGSDPEYPLLIGANIPRLGVVPDSIWSYPVPR